MAAKTFTQALAEDAEREERREFCTEPVKKINVSSGEDAMSGYPVDAYLDEVGYEACL